MHKISEIYTQCIIKKKIREHLNRANSLYNNKRPYTICLFQNIYQNLNLFKSLLIEFFFIKIYINYNNLYKAVGSAIK